MVFVSNTLTRYEASIRLASHGIGRKELDLKPFKKLTSYKVHLQNGLDRGFKYSTKLKENSMNRILKRAQEKLNSASAKASAVVATVATVSSNAFAADPAWLTSVTTELSNIPTMISGVIVTGVAIYMAPIAWSKIKHAIGRS